MTRTARRQGARGRDALRTHGAEPGAALRDEANAALIEALPEAVWLVDADTLRVRTANAAAARLLGVPAQALRGRSMSELCATPEDLCFWSEVAIGASERIISDSWVQRADGSLLPVTRSVSRAAQAHGADLFVVALHDRSAELRAAQESESALAGLRATLESTADGILVTDLAGRIVTCNRRFAALWNLDAELLARCDDTGVREWMARNVADPAAYAERLAAIEEAPTLQTSDVFKLRSGRIVERVTLPQTSRGQPIGRVYSFRDITAQLEAHQRIEQLSHTDPLTGLPNRRLLADRIEHALAMAQRDGTPFAVLFLDLDRFKHINDSLGHQFGDRVLTEVSERIKSCLRQVDTVARLGGDEFVMVMHQADAAGAQATAQRVIEAMSRPFAQGGLSFTVTCSIGIALYPNDGETLDELLRHADKAMYSVKEGGRAGYRFHQPRKDVDLRSRMRIDHAMRQGLANGDFRLDYQPQVELASGRVVGAEALLRWHDAEFGAMLPADFIGVAEESGFIVAIGEWVLAEAVRQAAQWRAQGLEIVVAVNVSALQFQRPDFAGGVARTLQGAGLPAHGLELELTESILIQDAQEALARLEALAQLGVRLAIDDFGTGYSSLAYLKRFPIRQLKIDRSFIDGLPGDESDAAIVQAIISMGRALRLRVIAEGVETEAQRRFLQSAGCDLYQGFVFAPALDAQRLFELASAAPQPATRGMRLVG
ncbi:MAG TPA: EAL domain-containing protein [Burkholderiaceae bacterium]|nr:EAL domain-containing protein [Burkholderiaceae bacterium]